MDRFSRQKVNKATEILKDTTEQLDLIDIFQDIISQKNKNISSSQVHMEHSQELITYWGIKLTSTNLRV